MIMWYWFILLRCHIIHTIGPVYDSKCKEERAKKAEQLESAYRTSLALALKNSIRHVVSYLLFLLLVFSQHSIRHSHLSLLASTPIQSVMQHGSCWMRSVLDILKIGAFCSIWNLHVPLFDRYFSQLQTFTQIIGLLFTNEVSFLYLNMFKSESLPQSKWEYAIQGLNLICLLTQDCIANFHTTLESLDADVIAENVFNKHAVNLERWLMREAIVKSDHLVLYCI